MSKAFDTVRRDLLMDDLRTILTPGELKILVEDVRLIVRIGNEKSDTFQTKMGVPQGDCLSPILFTLYLANALKEPNHNQDHTYHSNIEEVKNINLPSHLQDHTYSTQTDIGLLIKPQYADDISWGAANCTHKIHHETRKTTPKLTARGLMVNESKNEDYGISATSNNQWKNARS